MLVDPQGRRAGFDPVTGAQVAWLLMQPTDKLEEEDRSYVERLLEVSPTVHKAYTLGLAFHDLRHTAAPLMLADGVPMVTVSKILGHSHREPPFLAQHRPSDTLNLAQTLVI